jgi:hypothetical protein
LPWSTKHATPREVSARSAEVTTFFADPHFEEIAEDIKCLGVCGVCLEEV